MQVDIAVADDSSAAGPALPAADFAGDAFAHVAPLTGEAFADYPPFVDNNLEPNVAHSRAADAAPADPQYDVNNIKTEYHPHSGQETVVMAFENFTRARSSTYQPPRDDKPWRPFASRTDFEFAELVLDAALSKKQVNALLKLVHRIKQGEDSLTFTTYNDVQQAWADASPKVTPVSTYISL